MDHQGASTCTWIIFICGMHSINIRRVSAGVLLGVTCMTTVTTMPSSTGKLNTEALVQREEILPICCLLHEQQGRTLVNLETVFCFLFSCFCFVDLLCIYLHLFAYIHFNFPALVSMVYARKVYIQVNLNNFVLNVCK